MNPRYGDFDPYDMAASAIDEAVRNCVAVGADPRRIAILDNFCWGDCETPETLGSLVRAALACHDVSLVLETPFISGKDSLNNEFSSIFDSPRRRGGTPESSTIAIPPSLLISAIGQIDDVSRCVTMDLKQPGNLLYLVGETHDELGGSHFALVNNLDGGAAPKVDADRAKATFAAMHRAIAERAGRRLPRPERRRPRRRRRRNGLRRRPRRRAAARQRPRRRARLSPAALLFSESNTRFLCEVDRRRAARVRDRSSQACPCAHIGIVRDDDRLIIAGGDQSAPLDRRHDHRTEGGLATPAAHTESR